MLGACVPKECGGRGLVANAVLPAARSARRPLRAARRCSSTPTTRSARGPSCCSARRSSKQQWLPKLASGEWISAFALTEPEAGCDAANVQTTATPTADGTRLHPQRPETLDHQRRHRPGADRDGPHARRRQRRNARSPPSSSRPTCPASKSSKRAWPSAASAAPPPRGWRSTTCSCRKENILGQLGKGLQGRAHRARLRPHHVRRQLHRRGQVLRRPSHAARQHARAVRPAARRVRAGQRKARLHGGRRLRDGSRHLSNRRADRLAATTTTCSKRPCSRSSPPTRCGGSSTTRSRSTAARPTSPTSRTSG